MNRITRRLAVAALAPCIALSLGAVPASAQLSDILLGPKTLIDRAIEARSSSDIARDNAIVIDVNRVMAELGTIKASTVIYEQKLLVTGLFADAETYKKFETGVRKVEGVKKLYWHVTYMTDKAKDDAIKAGRMMDWTDVLAFETKAQARLIGTAGVADVNFRVTADPYGNLYLLGRARSREELKKALDRLNEGEGVKKVYNYASVRP
jgi:osmotically-inducible protein OsmY